MRTSGFTLIELMIVVAIIGILSALAIPDFMKMIAKTKQSEAKTNLGAIYTCQIAYFAETQTYAGKSTPDGDAFELIGWHPESPEVINYAYILDEAVITGPRLEFPSGMPTGIASTRSSFMVIAAGNIDTDPTVDTWTMNEAKDLDNITNDVRY